jgi:hypothetical protein
MDCYEERKLQALAQFSRALRENCQHRTTEQLFDAWLNVTFQSNRPSYSLSWLPRIAQAITLEQRCCSPETAH